MKLFTPKLRKIEVLDIKGDDERLIATMWFISEEDFTSTIIRLTTSAPFNSLRRDRKNVCLIKVIYDDSSQSTYYTDQVTPWIRGICEEYQQTYSRAEQMLQPAKWSIKGWLLGPEKRLVSILKLMPAAKQIHELGTKASPEHLKNIIYVISAVMLLAGCDILLGSNAQPSPKCKNIYKSEYGCLNNKTYVAQDFSQLYDADHIHLQSELKAVKYHVNFVDSSSGIVSIKNGDSILNMTFEYSVMRKDSCSRILRFPVYDPRTNRYIIVSFSKKEGGNFASLSGEATNMMFRYSLSYDQGAPNDYLISFRNIEQ